MVPEICSATDQIFCYFGSFFALLPPNNSQNKNSEKMKKIPGDIIILQMCTINGNHMMYFCHFGSLLPFYPTSNPQNQNFLKMKKIP